MEVAKFISLFLVVFFSLQGSAKQEQDTCRDHKGIRVINEYTIYKFDKTGTKRIDESIGKGPMVRQWSNLSDKLHKVYYEYDDPKFKADEVQIIYTLDSKNKIISNKVYTMADVSVGVLKVKDFKFSDGIQLKILRPARQIYLFKKNKKLLCSILVEHTQAIEMPD
jgi:hypothetical protein